MVLKIAFEGADGSGKSTQAELLVKFIKKFGIKVNLYHEPRILRDEIFAKCKEPGVDDAEISYMFGVDGYLCRETEGRRDSYQQIIIRDRDTTISQYPYHYGFGTSEHMIYLMSYLLNKQRSVDLVFLVDLDFDIAFERIKARSIKVDGKPIVDYFEKEEKLRKIHQNYRELFNSPDKLKKMALDKVKIIIIDGNKDIDTMRHEVQDKFLEVVKFSAEGGPFMLKKDDKKEEDKAR